MYIHKLVIVICAVAFVKANDDFEVLDSIYDETPCLMKGGMCVIAADCPEGYLERERGLCPEQQRREVECCYGQSVKEIRCEKRGGFCSERCNDRHIEPRATDCARNTICCILTK